MPGPSCHSGNKTNWKSKSEINTSVYQHYFTVPSADYISQGLYIKYVINIVCAIIKIEKLH